jgi:membrane-associated phospholipid phosphatase
VLIERRRVLVWGVVFAVLTVVAVLWIDRPLASAMAPVAFLRTAVDGIENVFGFSVSKWLTGAVLVVAGLALFVFRRRLAWMLLFAGLSQLTTRLIAGMLKNVFLRPRPFEGGDFFTTGSSFPSGHAAHFWPLYFAAAIAFPRLRWPLLVLALFVSVARVAVNDHYVGDVTASVAIAAFVVAGWGWVLRERIVTPGTP